MIIGWSSNDCHMIITWSYDDQQQIIFRWTSDDHVMLIAWQSHDSSFIDTVQATLNWFCNISYMTNSAFLWFGQWSREVLGLIRLLEGTLSDSVTREVPGLIWSLERRLVWLDYSRGALSDLITREVLGLIWWKCQIIFPWKGALYFLTSL